MLNSILSVLKLQFAEHNLGIELCFVRHQICRIKTPTYDNLQLARINDIALILLAYLLLPYSWAAESKYAGTKSDDLAWPR